jgi:hypothetical protein
MVPTLRCPIFQAPERVRGSCDGCGAALPKRRQRWCSDLCWQRYFYNHGWTAARHEALRRATVYVDELREAARWNNKTFRSEPTGELETVQVAVWRPCDNCGVDTLEGGHPTWYPAEMRKPLALAAEVNHVEARRGAGYDEGCWNHQTNLQVLCHACHLAETADQRLLRSVALDVDLGRITAAEAVQLLAGQPVARLQVVHPTSPGVGLDLIVPLWDAA